MFAYCLNIMFDIMFLSSNILDNVSNVYLFEMFAKLFDFNFLFDIV